MIARSLRTCRIIAPIVLITVLAGCQASGSDDLLNTNAPTEISAPAASAIAGDMVSRLAEQIGPGKATIYFETDTSPSGRAMDTALRTWGYAIVARPKADEKKSVIALSYSVTMFEGQVLARLSTDKVELGRAYAVTESGATPASALSLLKRG